MGIALLERRQAIFEGQVEKPLRGTGARLQLRPGDARRPVAKGEGDKVVLLFGEQQRRTAAEGLLDAPAIGFDAPVVGHEVGDHHAAGTKGASKDRKSTRLNSSHLGISYAVFCLKKKKKK